MTATSAASDLQPQWDELRGFSRTVAEIQWLLLILVLLYQVVAESATEERTAIYTGLFFYGALVVGFRYYNFYRRDSLWKLAAETWAMLLFISFAVWFSGKLESPLLNLYLLPIITSALTLGKLSTLLEAALVCACYILLGSSVNTASILSSAYWSAFLAQVAPVLLVAYITTMLSADIHYAVGRLRELSETDELTGIYNIRAFNFIAEKTLLQAARYSQPFSLVMVDSDDLKRINDHYGHEAGNHLLQSLVTATRKALRATDIMARYGGDEFVVMLPHTNAKGAAEVAEKIRASVEISRLSVRGQLIPITVSIGIASYPENGDTYTDLLEAADRAMYQAKQQGKNRVSQA